MIHPIFAFLFLSPLTAVLTAVGAASIPIVIHLLNRKRFRVVPWAAMRFLRAAQKRTVRKLRIEQWLLLTVRTLLILLLILAMVSVLPWLEPVWNRVFPGASGPGVVKAGRTHRIIVVDGSFSMGRKHDDGTSFERARNLARRIVQTSSPGDGFSLMLAGSPVQSIVPGPSDNAGNVTTEIQQLRLPHGNSDFAGTVAALDKLAAAPLGKYQRREVYILTDLQKTFFQGGLKSLGPKPDSPGLDPKSGDADPWQRLQTRASVILVDVAREGADNLAVTNLILAEPLAMANTLNAVTATIHNFGSADREQLKVDLLIGKARPDDDAKDAAGAAPFSLKIFQQLLVNVPVGAGVPVTFPLGFTTPGEYIVQVRIEDDALPLDNVRSLAVRVRDSVPVLIVEGKTQAQGDDRSAHHLAIALNPASAPGLSPFRPKVINTAQLADPSEGDLDPYDCVFLCDVDRLSERKIEKLETFLKRGGGVVFCLGGQVDAEAYNRLLYKNGEGLLPAKLLGRKRADADQFFTFTADEENFLQPPLAAFAADGDRATLLSAHIRQYIQVELPAKSTAKRLLSFLPADGKTTGPKPELDPAVLEWTRHRGRVILITTPLNIDWGSWPGSASYLPFVHELARHAALGSPPRVANSGEPLIEYLPANLRQLEAAVTTPDMSGDAPPLSVPITEQDEIATVRIPDTDQSGIYRMTIGANRREYLFAVNVPATTAVGIGSESDLRRIDPEELRASAPEGDIQIVTDLSQIQRKARAVSMTEDAESAPKSSAGPAVARIVLFFFFALLILETILAWQFGSARTVVPPDALATPVPRPWYLRLFDPRNAAYFPLVLVVLIGFVLFHESVTDEFLGFAPSSWRARLEHYLIEHDAAPGEGTRLKLEYLSYLTGRATADRWLAFGLALGTAGLAIFIYRRERVAMRVRVPGDNMPASRPFWPLAGMRIAIFLLTLIIFLPQLRLLFEREGWPDVVILIDTSRSMSKPDDYQDPKVKEQAEQLALDWSRLAKPKIAETTEKIQSLEKALAGNPTPEKRADAEKDLADQKELLAELNSPDRLNLIKALVAGKDRDWINELLKKRQVKVHVYQCSTRTARLVEVIDGTHAEAAIEAIRDLRPLGESSELGGAVKAVLNDFRGGSLGAIIMITDGVTTEGDTIAQAARHAARADVPLYLVGVGDAHEPRDLILHDLQAEDSINLRDRLVFDVRVSVKGKIEAKSVKITLSEKGKDGALEKLKEETVVLDPNAPVKVRMVTTPTTPGDKTFVISVPEQPDETDKSNNRIEKQVHVADAKPVKLLYIEGYPRYEFRFIKTLLERERASKQGNKSITLSTLLCDADPDFAVQDKTAIAEFPAKDELFTYDAIILGDVDPKHPKLGEERLRLLRDYVRERKAGPESENPRERGGGLLFIAGEQHMPHSYKDTALADVLPLNLSLGGDVSDPAEKAILDAGLNDGYRPNLTAVGQQHPIFRFATDDADNARIWANLPPLFWAASGYRAKPTAEVLAVHPLLPARRTVGESGEAEWHPLVVQQFVGAGRAMFFGFDETWRWRFRENELYFNNFWIQTVHYLARTKVGRVDIHLDKQTPYRRNEPIRVTVRFPDDVKSPATDVPIKVMVERSRLRKPGESRTAPPELIETQSLQWANNKDKAANKDGHADPSRRTFETLLTRTPEGEYKFWLAAPNVDGPRPTVETRVLPPPGELDRLQMNQAEMEKAATESRGKFFTLADAATLPDELPDRTRVALNQPRPPWSLWNHAAMFLLAIGLLTSEWVLRKRRRLL